MGNYFGCIRGCLDAPQEFRVVMVGLDFSGKSTILYQMKYKDQAVALPPTIGFNVEVINRTKRHSLVVWDIGGQESIRALWKHYFLGVHGIVFVVDSADIARLENSTDSCTSARDELRKILSDKHIKYTPLLIFANKQDYEDSLSPEEITEKLDLKNVKDRQWKIFGSCALKNEGLHEGFQWLEREIFKHLAEDIHEHSENNVETQPKLIEAQKSSETIQKSQYIASKVPEKKVHAITPALTMRGVSPAITMTKTSSSASNGGVRTPRSMSLGSDNSLISVGSGKMTVRFAKKKKISPEFK